MRSLTPGMPGRRQQMPRTIKSMRTPACDARYNSWMMPVSVMLLILKTIAAGRPAGRGMRALAADELVQPPAEETM